MEAVSNERAKGFVSEMYFFIFESAKFASTAKMWKSVLDVDIFLKKFSFLREQ